MAISEMVDVVAAKSTPTDGRGVADDRVGDDDLGFVPDQSRRYTAAEVRALNAANPKWWPRYECVHGELLVTPGPGFGHQLAAQRTSELLNIHLRRVLPGALAMLSPADISWGGRRDTSVQPDVFVMAPDVVRAVQATGKWRDATQLLLAVETASPGSVKHDRVTKRDLYLKMGVPMYWILDPSARHVEVWVSGATEAAVERVAATWQPAGAGEPFVLDISALFAAV